MIKLEVVGESEMTAAVGRMLGANVAMLVAAAAGTLTIQRALARRATDKRALEAGAGR